MTAFTTAEVDRGQRDIEKLRLAAICRRCLDDLEGLNGFDLRSEMYDKAVERIEQAIYEAMEVVRQTDD